MNNYDVIVLGGGAAGLMCAMVAGQRGRRVLVLEGANKVGKKILMSGGGHCNFTNLHCEPSRFISANPHFCKSALSRYTQWDFVALVEKHGIAYHEKALGQLFCNGPSKNILNMLESECADAGVKVLTDCDIESVTKTDEYVINTSAGKFAAGSLVIATGGLSIPKMGATNFGYRLARQFGLHVLDTRAGLVPFTFTGAMHELTDRLSGLSVPVVISTADGRVSFTESILFTHRGLSGPAVLQISSFWQQGEAIHVNLLPDRDASAWLLKAKSEQPKVTLNKALGMALPKKLVQELQLLWWPGAGDTRLAEVPAALLTEIGNNLNNWVLKPAATEGYRTAEVTLGGVDTNELSSRTLEVKRQPGLYCIGEVVDVTGQLGGFNFQWAWSSGQAAGQVV
ncbi:MAG: NAD(P)/FAD-dependent oxidoreductase [Gammaproteobacteria bacterium]